MQHEDEAELRGGQKTVVIARQWQEEGKVIEKTLEASNKVKDLIVQLYNRLDDVDERIDID